MFDGEEMRGKLQEHLQRLKIEPNIKTKIPLPAAEMIEASNAPAQQQE
jgi:hypothetical protein